VTKLSPFTLIYEPAEGTSRRVGDTKVPDEMASTEAPKKLAETLESIDLRPELRRTLLYTCAEQRTTEDKASGVLKRVRPVVEELTRQPKVTTIGLWDLDANIGQLPEIIKVLNAAQPALTFFHLQGVPLSSGLIGRPELVADWLADRLDRKPTKKERAEIGDNLYANEFYEISSNVRKSVGVDYLVGITSYMIASEDDEQVYWNLFADWYGRLVLVSTYGLREYATKADRPIEVALAMLFVAAASVAMNRRLDYHDDEDTGCLLDRNMSRDNIVESLRQLKIDEACLRKFDRKNREPTLAMLEALRVYSGKVLDIEPVAPVDYSPYLEQLDKLAAE
jgi:hypothetical protein